MLDVPSVDLGPLAVVRRPPATSIASAPPISKASRQVRPRSALAAPNFSHRGLPRSGPYQPVELPEHRTSAISCSKKGVVCCHTPCLAHEAQRRDARSRPVCPCQPGSFLTSDAAARRRGAASGMETGLASSGAARLSPCADSSTASGASAFLEARSMSGARARLALAYTRLTAVSTSCAVDTLVTCPSCSSG